MTEETRLAQLRHAIENEYVGAYVSVDSAKFLLQLLDTERAERARVEEECAELNGIFELQCTRMAEATLRWREATGEHAVSPDLGHLLAWLMLTADLATAQQEQAESALAAARERVEEYQWSAVNLFQALADLDHLSLVITSAVSAADPEHAGAVIAAFKSARAALTPETP